MTNRSARSPLDWMTAAVLAAAPTVPYLLTTGPSPMSDGVSYAARIESADPRRSVDRQHVLNGVAGYLPHGYLSSFGLRPGIWDPLLALIGADGCLAPGLASRSGLPLLRSSVMNARVVVTKGQRGTVSWGAH